MRERIGPRSNGQVAEYVGVSPSTVHYWKTGRTRPEYKNVLRLARYLEVEPEEVERRLGDEPHGRSEGITRDQADRLIALLEAQQAAGTPAPLAHSPAETATTVEQFRPYVEQITGRTAEGYRVLDDSLRGRLNLGWIAWILPGVSPWPGQIAAVRDGEQMRFREVAEAGGRRVLTSRDGSPPEPYDAANVAGVVVIAQHAP